MGKDARGIWLLVPVSIVLTLETAFVGFIPAARRLIVALQAKNIIADVGNVEAQAAVDFSVVNGTKPFFKLHINFFPPSSSGPMLDTLPSCPIATKPSSE